MGIGTPVSGGNAALSSAEATAFSAARAWSAASSAVTVKNAPTWSLSSCVRRR